MKGKWRNESDEKPRYNKRCHVKHDGKILMDCFYIHGAWYNYESDSYFDGPATWRYSGNQKWNI